MKGSGGVFAKTKSHKGETLQHFFTKVMIMKLLLDKNHSANIEVHVPTGSIDCYDFTTRYAYEVEPVINQEKLKKKFETYSLSGAREVVMVPYKQLWDILGIAPENLDKWKKAIDSYLNA